MDVFIDDELDEDEAADEVPALVIDDGQPRFGPRTIFMDAIYDKFESDGLNILALMKAYNWTTIANIKKFEDSYESSDEELGAIICADSALMQVHTKCFKVNKKLKSI